jgi:hypothetical protein
VALLCVTAVSEFIHLPAKTENMIFQLKIYQQTRYYSSNEYYTGGEIFFIFFSFLKGTKKYFT